MNKLQIKTYVLGMVMTNCYIINLAGSKEAIVIDPADNGDQIEKHLKENGLECKAILLTHGHYDHILGIKELVELVHAPVYAMESELNLLKDAKLNHSYHHNRECTIVPDVLLKDKEVLTIAGIKIEVIHTPGHTAGGTCYYLPEHMSLFSGDTLFKDSIGRSDLPTGNGEDLIESIQIKLMILEDNIICYPGHGSKTTIGYEKDNNVFLNG